MTDDHDSHPPESEPYCRHWSVLWDCDMLCRKCKHKCRQHDEDGCDEADCECTHWHEPDEKAKTFYARNAKGIKDATDEIMAIASEWTEGVRQEHQENDALTQQVIRATAERRALLKVVRAKGTAARKVALLELSERYPSWEGWG